MLWLAGLFYHGCATYPTKYNTFTAKFVQRSRRYGRVQSSPKQGSSRHSSDSGACRGCLRIFRTTLHRGEISLAASPMASSGRHTYHPVDSQRKSKQSRLSDGRRRSKIRRDIAVAIMWLRLRSGPVIIVSGAGRGAGSMLRALSIVAS